MPDQQKPDLVNPVDAAKLFQEHDELGSESSLWLRVSRTLMRDGKPPGQFTVLTLRHPHGGQCPFGAMTVTQRNRIVFWPVLPKETGMVAEKREFTALDHVTLELPSERIHATAYNARGRACHYNAANMGHDRSWRLQHFVGHKLSLWFTMAFRPSLLINQERAVQRVVAAPTPDLDRRLAEFGRFPTRIAFINLNLPCDNPDPNYVYCMAYLATEPLTPSEFSAKVFATANLHDQVDGFAPDMPFQIQPTMVRYPDRTFVFALACPPGRLETAVIVGFPRQGADHHPLGGMTHRQAGE